MSIGESREEVTVYHIELETFEDPWGHEVRCFQLYDAVTLYKTEETWERKLDPYFIDDIEEVEVMVEAVWQDRYAAKFIEFSAVDGWAHSFQGNDEQWYPDVREGYWIIDVDGTPINSVAESKLLGESRS